MQGQGLSARAALATAGDPRRPDSVNQYQPRAKPDEKVPNLTLIMAALMGMGAMLLKVRELSLLGLVFIASALATADSNFEWSQLVQTGTMTVMGLFTSYATPYLQMQKYNAAVKQQQAGGLLQMPVQPPGS